MSNLTNSTSHFSVTEKVQYALKTALFRTMQTAFGDSGSQEIAAPPRIFPKDIMQTNLVEIGKGDIDDDGYFVSRTMGTGYSWSGTNTLAPVEAAELIVAKYRIINPSDNIITSTTVEMLAGDYSGKTQTQINAMPTSGQTYPWKNWFFRGHYTGANDSEKFSNANSTYDGLQLAWDKATPNTTATEADIVPHLKYYLQVQTNHTGESDGNSPDNHTYIHDKMKGLIGLESSFTSTISVNRGEGGNCTNLNTTGTPAGEYWFTQATSGTLAFYGVGTSDQTVPDNSVGNSLVNANDSLSNLSSTKFPMISYVRYVGETGFGASSGGGGSGGTAVGLSSDELYTFTSHTFTNCGSTGRYGPSKSQCTTAYSSASWASQAAFFDVPSSSNGGRDGYQLWTVPVTGEYTITAGGASDGWNEGLGATITSTYTLNKGDKYWICIGQKGIKNNGNGGWCASGGGGGTFMVRRIGEESFSSANIYDVLIIAGGGGGSMASNTSSVGNHGQDSTEVRNSFTTETTGGEYDGTGNGGGGGGGFTGNGTHVPAYNHQGVVAMSFVNGLAGGSATSYGSVGGFGGGGVGGGNPGGGGGGVFGGNWANLASAYTTNTDVGGDAGGSYYRHSGTGFKQGLNAPGHGFLSITSITPVVGIGADKTQIKLDVNGTIHSDGLNIGSNFSFSKEIKINSSDLGSNDEYGKSVDTYGNYAIVGAIYDDANGFRSGSAYIFDVATGTQLHKLVADDAAANMWFGSSVGIDGNYAIIGAHCDPSNFTGSAYIFDVATGTQVHKLLADDGAASDYFGFSVAISGNYAIVGAYQDDDLGSQSGSAYIFNVTTGTKLHKITGGDSNDNFGHSVAISGIYAIVGAKSDQVTNVHTGSAYIFNVETGTQLHKLSVSYLNDGNFGYSVGIDGNYAIVGAHTGFNKGNAYIFNVTTGEQLHTLTASDVASGDYFGYSVAIQGNYAIVGSQRDNIGLGSNTGSAYIFNAETGTQIKKITSSDAAVSDFFGSSVSIFGGYAVVGAIAKNVPPNTGWTGSAYIFGSDSFLKITKDSTNLAVNGDINFTGKLNGITIELELYDFTSHTFSNAGAEGPYGPTLIQCRNTYSSSGWALNNDYFKMSYLQGYQEWTVPQSGTYRITAVGASSGSDRLGDDFTNGARGQGAMLRGDFSLEKGEIIRIVVGQRGQNQTGYSTCGGGGGSFVVKAPYNTKGSILVIAGGGGSAESPTYDAENNQHATTETSGQNSYLGSTTSSGGTGGNGGGVNSGNSGGGGGGFFTDGANSSSHGEGGKAFTNSSKGCWGGDINPTNGGYGGFGGGGGPYGNGGGTGAGGGYSGGGGSDNAANARAGGGGSYNANAISGTASGETGLFRYNNGNTGWDHGYVIIEKSTENVGGGRVGIGTTTPQYTLDVKGIIASDGLNVGKDFSFSKETKITASDGAASHQFGSLWGIAIDGNYAIVGASGNNDNGTGSGGAYIFDVTTGTELHKLTASDGAASDYFGRVAISGNYAIVSAYYDDDGGSNSGSVYIFDVTTGTELHKIIASDAAAYDYFGSSVAISGNYAIVGANGGDDGGNDSGSAYIFDVTSGTELHKITASDGATNSGFGYSVGIDGNYAIVGANAADIDGTNSGRAYIFNVATGTEERMLSSNDIAVQDQFGNSVAISGNYAIVGARYDDDNGTSSGSAYIFDVTSGTQLHKLVDKGGQANDDFGQSVAISGNYAIVGARQYRNSEIPNRGAVFMYDVISGTEIKKITASDAANEDYFGYSLAISGNYAIVGAKGDDDKGSGSGSAYIFGPTKDSLLKITNDSPNLAVNGDINFTGKLNGNITIALALYDFTSHTFTNCGSTGRFGPSLFDCTSAYSSAGWTSNTNYFDTPTNGYQLWTVPVTGKYTIAAKGASDGWDQGKGATITARYTLTQGDKYWICVGQKGLKGSAAGNWWASGGGGGTFMVKKTSGYSGATINDVLMIAGGGGGSSASSGAWNVAGNNSTEVSNSLSVSTAGGGYTSSTNGGGGGAGLIGNATGAQTAPEAASFTNGLVGANTNPAYSAAGGFGGGGDGGGNPGGGGGGVFGGNFADLASGYTTTYNVGGDGGGSYYRADGEGMVQGLNVAGDGSLTITNDSPNVVVNGTVVSDAIVSKSITSDGLNVGKDFSFNKETKITASDGAANKRFGNSVAINGNYVIVGAHYANKAYIYNLYTGDEILKLTPSDGDTGQFGVGVAISGNYAIVGMRTGGSNGKAYIFNVQSGEELHIITHIPSAGAESAYFGEYVAIDGDYAIVGASYEYHATTNRYGHAYIFNVTTGTQLHKLTADDPSNRQFFGKSVAISGNYAIIGANSDDASTNPGAAYIFNITTGTQLHKLTDTNGANADSFGISVAISGNYAIVGAYGDDDNHSGAGSAFIYNVQTGGFLYKLHASDDVTNNYFGYNVGIDGNYAIVGCGYLYGASANPGAYIFDVQTGKEVKILKSSDMVSSDEFGYSVAISSNYAIIGSHKDDDNGTDSGSAYIFGPSEEEDYVLKITNDSQNLIVNGNVGIGTVNPYAKLIVQGTSEPTTGSGYTNTPANMAWPIVVNNVSAAFGNVTNAGYGCGIKFKQYFDNIKDQRWSGIAGVSEGRYSDYTGLTFYTCNNYVTTEKMRILHNGNVGFGIADPTAPLHIRNTALGDLIRFEGSGNYRAAIGFGTHFSDYPAGELSTQALPGGQPTQGGLIIQCRGSDGEGAALWMNGSSAGIVNPGDNHTWSWRDEDGYAASTLNYSWHITNAGALVNNSDIRLKENIRYFDDEYEISEIKEKYAQIKFCKYNWIKPLKDPSGVKTDHYGIIAQELEIKFPEMIEFDGPTDTRMLNQERMKYISYYVIQDLVKENQELKTKVSTLETELAAIKQHLGI